MRQMADGEDVLLEWLRKARTVLAFCGAGVSAESGVPTFRDAGGLWEGRRVEDVATPEGFARDPGLVWRFYATRQERLGTLHPNPAHDALAAMEGRYGRFLLVTQNVDDLHERAGSRRLVKLHGNLMEVRCVACGRVTALSEPVREARVLAGDLPRCGCGGLLRPNVVWFGEYLDPGHLRRIRAFYDEILADPVAARPALLLVIGTSGAVSGGYGLTDLARLAGARVVEINPRPTMLSGEADLVVREPAGALLGRLWPRVLDVGG